MGTIATMIVAGLLSLIAIAPESGPHHRYQPQVEIAFELNGPDQPGE